ncbi:MAG: pyridoxamine 5'-phosphate oxidase [Bacteroidales bacterium]
MELEGMRREFRGAGLRKEKAGNDPILLFAEWFAEAIRHNKAEPNAMAISTVSSEGVPSIRIVLLKSFGPEGFSFYTNYGSSKAQDLEKHPFASALFYWPSLDRQIRLSGKVMRTGEKESDRYFYSRPFGSRISAVISPQSQKIPSREWLENKWQELFDQADEESLKRPEYWGGYRIIPEKIEFWQGRENRLHDRLLFTMNGNGWEVDRLAP